MKWILKMPPIPENKNLDEIRVVNSEEEKTMSSNFQKLANALQVSVNGLQKQIFRNKATFSLHDKKISEVGFSNLFNGLSLQMAQPFLVTYPCLQVRKIMRDSGSPNYAVNFATAFCDTLIGTPLEATSLMKTLKLVGINLQLKDLALSSARSFAPFMVRNTLSWTVVNDSRPIEDKALTSVGAAVVSTPFNNIGVKIAENSINRNLRDTMEAVVNQIKENPALLIKGMSSRVISVGILSSILLSSRVEEYIEKKCQEIFVNNKPSTSPQNHNVGQLKPKDPNSKDYRGS